MAKFTRRDFQLGEWWVAKRPGSPGWYRFRFDAKTRQTIRVSLGTDDLQEAKDRLTEWWIANTLKKEREASDVLLAEVLLAYWHQHASKLPSGKRIKASMRHLTEFFDGMTVKEACHPGQIDLFVQAMLAKNFARTYINNLLGIIKAATQRAWKRGELASAPFIELIEAQRKAPKGEPLKPKEIASLLAHANKNTRTMIMLMLGTGCRPQAACELTWEQIDLEAGLIDLNQKGRIQTVKYRPIVRIPPSLREYLLTIRKPSGLLITHGGRVIRRWETAWRNCRTNAGLGRTCNPYSIRHTVARWLRANKVMKWEIENQMGHSKLSTTDQYAPHAPDYLVDACAAIEKLMLETLAHQKRDAA